jgi:hypothetical protein
MNFPAAEAIIRARLLSEWPHSDVPIYWANEENILPDQPAPFLLVEIIGDGESLYAHGGGRGANVWRGEGAIAIHILVPKGQGTQGALGYLEDAFTIFRGLRIDGVSYEAGMAQGSGTATIDGAYWQVDGEVSFHTYLIG